ncbi:MAG: hypothetical protein AAGK78_10025 [Planctomycetota bacterium]
MRHLAQLVGLLTVLCWINAALAAEPSVVADNEKQQYFLIGEPAENMPDEGWGVLLVLPGGDGSADFHPFVRNIGERFAPEGYLTIQLVAVAGDPNLTWPTRTSLERTEKQAFTTEDHAAAVLADVEANLPDGVRLNPTKRLALGWSSGGVAVQALLSSADLNLAGAFIAMSICSLADLKPSDMLDDKAIAWLQSPQDRMTPWMHVNRAREIATDAGAAWWQRGYAGGHGWKGDSLDKLRAGLLWLDEQISG